MNCQLEPFCLTANISAATATVYPQVTLLDSIGFSVPYRLVGLHLASAFTAGAGFSGVVVVIGQSENTMAVDSNSGIIASHVVTQGAARDVFISFERTNLIIAPGKKISLYGSLVATANQALISIACLHLVQMP